MQDTVGLGRLEVCWMLLSLPKTLSLLSCISTRRRREGTVDKRRTFKFQPNYSDQRRIQALETFPHRAASLAKGEQIPHICITLYHGRFDRTSSPTFTPQVVSSDTVASSRTRHLMYMGTSVRCLMHRPSYPTTGEASIRPWRENALTRYACYVLRRGPSGLALDV